MRRLGTLTPATLRRARQLAACAPAPGPEIVARLRALLGVGLAR